MVIEQYTFITVRRGLRRHPVGSAPDKLSLLGTYQSSGFVQSVFSGLAFALELFTRFLPTLEGYAYRRRVG